ncbi:MAG: protein-export membrane protein SecD [Candidatus Yanofskybacteria bacterium RIFCSPLOWO2_02_FULL_47_9b]|uniref:Protein translocase subunit SecD n=1 Tax=Candidatus Yanofskybacteria bacterium RIFCSPLOWO2_02_FULL_47_9b TaxID=1802708 RepID=A0A1F8H689_9BACT|nr:MAG: protein-export membrane protein SecD [Candidatus Yanofskybacteria bacterium RIFCSPLOWO2_02_FULL_47_9b]
MVKTRLIAVLLLVAGALLGYFVYSTQASTSKYAFKLGLDLRGGSELIYKADTSKVALGEVGDAMASLRDVIERRVNLFGVTEPVVTTQTVSIGVDGTEHRLVVDLPGVTNIDQAISLIGQTPTLEFKTERDAETRDKILKQIEDLKARQEKGEDISKDLATLQDPYYLDSELTGRFLASAKIEFNSQTGAPYVSLVFNDEGATLFAEMTKANIGKTIAIYLDGQPISQPNVNEEITGGKAQITGGFTPLEAKQLAGRLNSGALPIPIELVGTQKVGASLGGGAFDKGVRAAGFGFALVALFLIIWYRLPGLVAVLALLMYAALVLTIFKLIPVTLTSAGIAGFILSIGIAVDANVLIFERMKEETKRGKARVAAIDEGFARAWTSIRDSNISSLITAAILFWFGTSLIQGFAVTWAIGVLVSMFSAIVVTKRLLRAIYT